MELIDTHQILRFIAALAFVLALMGGLAMVLKRVNNLHPAATPRKRRLKIVEILSLDARRRLMLISRDGREHLVILGPAGETVVETGIESPPESAQDTGTETGNNVTR